MIQGAITLNMFEYALFKLTKHTLHSNLIEQYETSFCIMKQ